MFICVYALFVEIHLLFTEQLNDTTVCPFDPPQKPKNVPLLRKPHGDLLTHIGLWRCKKLKTKIVSYMY